MLGSIVKASLSNLSNQTALLEACDWNEQEADAVCDYVASFLDSLTVSQETDWNEFVLGGTFSHKTSLWRTDCEYNY